MLESTVDLPVPRSPRSPRSPWSPGSMREVALDLDDAFSLADNEPAVFSASSLPSRADLQRLAVEGEWRDDHRENADDDDDDDVNGQYALESAHRTRTPTLDLPPSPITFRRSLSPSPSPTRNGALQLETPELPRVEPEPDTDIAELDLAMDAVDLQDQDAPEPIHLEIEPPPDDNAAMDEHPYPMVHIDVAHRTVKSISSLSGVTDDSDHSRELDSDHDRSMSMSMSISPSASMDLNHRAQQQPSVETSASASHSSQHSVHSVTSPSHSVTSPSSSSPGGAKSPRVTHTSHGPSALEKVLSKTRPSHLPPKNKEEDNKHLKDWEEMMRNSRAADEKRKALVMERRRAREAAVEASISTWEREIVPDYRAALRDTRLRSLWWNGIPSNLRGVLWERAIGNDIALSKDSFSRCSARGRRARESGVHPLGPSIMAAIEEDISTTLPSLHLFRPPTGPMCDDLRDMLCAFMIARADEGMSHYVPGTARVAAMLLLNLAPDRAFIAMRNLLERHCLRSFYGGPGLKEDVEAYYRIFDTLLADCMPKVYFNFKQHQISPSVYLADWLIPLFVDHLPVEACARVWDGIVLHGDAFLFRVALALLSNIEMRLFFPERKELLEVLRGENRAAQEVARRTGVLGPESEGAGKYAQYGVDEESVWQRIVEMDDWWKESTWTRLLQRELPDL